MSSKVIDAYRNEITKGYYMGEVGVGYSLEPFMGDPSGHYEGGSNRVRVRIPVDVSVRMSQCNEKILVKEGETLGFTLQEGIDEGWAKVLHGLSD